MYDYNVLLFHSIFHCWKHIPFFPYPFQLPLPSGEQLRWEKYAPGPVRTVVVAKAKAKPGAKAKGRGRKRKAESDDEGDGNVNIFNGSAESGAVAVPPSLDETVTSEVDDLFPIPSRATFAGRVRAGSTKHQSIFDARRAKFYEVVPQSFWEDHFERSFWTKCAQADDDIETGTKQFLLEIGIDPDKKRPLPSLPVRPKPKASPKPKAKAKTDKPHGGRGRARGRGRGGRGGAQCRWMTSLSGEGLVAFKRCVECWPVWGTS